MAATESKASPSTAAPTNDSFFVTARVDAINNNNLTSHSPYLLTTLTGEAWSVPVKEKITGPHCPKCERTFTSYTDQVINIMNHLLPRVSLSPVILWLIG
jgi:hypothetical protein